MRELFALEALATFDHMAGIDHIPASCVSNVNLRRANAACTQGDKAGLGHGGEFDLLHGADKDAYISHAKGTIATVGLAQEMSLRAVQPNQKGRSEVLGFQPLRKEAVFWRNLMPWMSGDLLSIEEHIAHQDGNCAKEASKSLSIGDTRPFSSIEKPYVPWNVDTELQQRR